MQRERHLYAQRLCGFQIDDKFELGWLQDQQLCRSLALKDRARIERLEGCESSAT